ncbi:hypothetical protein QFZ63_000571 [Streptomyces sp. B3I7]|uniref:hypothetical protein n=1 Tax=Streptomyces sp. B3I7 TaxID=3042269 RepID=UPI0027868BE1|nr:hypothetical protein [Streptomyces sp. B3I7]MDQ0808857.1 hypothetical protein [Streptomyces sp. B3I7]
MPQWAVTIPTLTAQGTFGTHVFIVTADRPEEACGHAVARADTPASRRHRRDATLRLAALTVAEITPRWSM